MRRPGKMDVKIKIMVLGLMALLIGACATAANKKAQQLEEDWKGKNFNDLIAAKGPPDEKLDDGQGGKIFIHSTYEYEQASVSGSWGSSSRGGGGGGGGRQGSGAGGGSSRGGSSKTSYLRSEMFWINPDGYIYRTAYQRNRQ